ncbi:MAG: AAA family ATPase [Chitinophagales bacterium]
MIKKIVFTGPESTGKTTLAELISQHLNLPYVKEAARDYLNGLNRKYAYEDILNIAMLQMSEEEKIKSFHPPFLICDTDLLTIKIWSEDKFQKCEHWVNHAFIDRAAEVYFLCTPDFPWQPDPQREDAERREELFHLYKQHLINSKIRFVELTGTIENRMEYVLAYLNHEQIEGGLF